MKLLVRISLILFLCCNLLTTVKVLAYKDRWDADKSDWTGLMLYAYAADSLKIDSALNAGGNINEQNAAGNTALSIAVRVENKSIVSFLLRKSADPNLSSTEEFTPLIWASSLPDLTIAKLLIQYGAHPNKKLRNGYTALMFATSFGTVEMMQLLVSKGADVNAKRKVDGMTALKLAEYDSNDAKIKFLKSCGARQ